MAVITNSVQAGGGGDYTTIQGAIDDFANHGAGAYASGDIWKIEIDDDSEYNESLTVNLTGTPSETSYVWITGGTSNRHSGVAGTGHPRLRADDGNHAITISDPYTRIEWLEIEQDGSGSSDEGIRVNEDADNVLISHCIIWTDDDTASQDGIYTGNWDIANLSIDNCAIYGFRRAQINMQSFSGAATQSINVDHCTLIHQSTTAETESGGLAVRQSHGSSVTTVNVYNTIGYMEVGTTNEPFFDNNGTIRGAPSGTMTWNGSHNLAGDLGTNDEIDATDNTSNWQFATDGDEDTTQSSGSYVVFEDIGSGTEDFRLLDEAAGNLAIANGTNRIGSEPDFRQNFRIDITGGIRSTGVVDIGAHQRTVLSSFSSAFNSAFDGGADGSGAVWHPSPLRGRRLTTVRM